MGGMHKGKKVDIDTLLDEFAEHQQRLISMNQQQSISSEEMQRIVDLMGTWHVSSFGKGSPVNKMEDLASLVGGDFRGTARQFDQQMFPLIKEFVALALEAKGDEYGASDVRNLNADGNSARKMYDLMKRSGLDEMSLQEAGVLVVAYLKQNEKKMNYQESLSRQVEAYLNKNVDDKDKEEVRRFLMGEWYDPNKNKGKVSQLRDAHEVKTGQVAVDIEVDAINSSQEKRTFTAKQLEAINGIYSRTLRSEPGESPSSVLRSSANKAAQADAAYILGNADRVFNTSPEATDTELKVAAKQHKLFQEQPDFKDKIKAKVNVEVKVPDVKTQAGFWKGIQKFFSSLENPFKKWLDKREEKQRAKNNPSPN